MSYTYKLRNLNFPVLILKPSMKANTMSIESKRNPSLSAN